jgi:phosphonate utilization associated putative membrane protein
MALTWPIVLAVLLGALLHASWNALVKSSSDKALDTVVIHLMGSVIAVPLILWLGWPKPESWPYIAASITIHIAYYLLLTGAYNHGDLGLTYPIMRGTAPLLVALVSVATLGEHLSVAGWLGVVAVSVGVLVLGLSGKGLVGMAGLNGVGSLAQDPKADALRSKAILFALANAVIIAIYTVVDALGARASGNALQYVVALFVLDGWPFAFIVFLRRGRAAHAQMAAYARQRWPVALGGAVASFGSYGIALWAMTHAPVATVAALRETSVLFAALLGAWLLKERFTPGRMVGTVIIVAGVMALRLA